MKEESIPDEELLALDKVKKDMDTLLDSVNKKINRWEKLVKYKFVFDTPSIEGGELTPTLKLRRNNILNKYEDVVEAIYAGEE